MQGKELGQSEGVASPPPNVLMGEGEGGPSPGTYVRVLVSYIHSLWGRRGEREADVSK